MCTDFLVFRDHKFAHRNFKSDNYVCYRTVICHALLWKINHSPNKNVIDDTVTAFRNFENAVTTETEHEDDTFLSLFISRIRNKNGYIIIDKSRGYYPLVAYPFTNKIGAPRSVALQYAVKDLSDKLPEIIDALINSKDWSHDLQESLQNNLFNYIEDEQET